MRLFIGVHYRNQILLGLADEHLQVVHGAPAAADLHAIEFFVRGKLLGRGSLAAGQAGPSRCQRGGREE